MIERRVALLNPKSVSAGVTVFVAITTNQHNSAWLERFHDVVNRFPEIVEAYRMSGQVDYLLRVVVPDIANYDKFYKAFIAQIDLTDVSSSFAMEQIKFTTALPLAFAATAARSGRGGRLTFAKIVVPQLQTMTQAIPVGASRVENARRIVVKIGSALLTDTRPAL